MGTIYFLFLIAVVISAALLVVRKINEKSYVSGSRNDTIHRRPMHADRLTPPAEGAGEVAGVDWYTRRHSASAAVKTATPDPVFVGTAFMSDEFEQIELSEKTAVH